jgi:hypothetical protein
LSHSARKDEAYLGGDGKKIYCKMKQNHENRSEESNKGAALTKCSTTLGIT